MKHLRNWFFTHRAAVLVLAAELLFLAVMARLDWRTGTPIRLSGSEIASYSDQTVIDENGVRLAAPVTENLAYATTTWLTLERGSWQVQIDYKAEGFGGQCYFINDVVQANTITLGPQSNSAVFSVTVTDGLDNAQIHFDVCGTDKDGNTQPSNLTILALSITPTRAMFRVHLATGVFLFLLLDLLVLLYTGSWNPIPTLRGRYIALGLVGIVLLASLPVFTDYLTWGHDLCYHLTRIQGLADGMAAGQFPVRISPTLLHGDGYAGNVFYCDLFLYPAALLRIWGFSLQTCYKIYLTSVNLGTALVTWFCLNRMLKKDWLALTGSALYTLSIYRMTNLYTRGAVGEYTAMLFFPLIVYGLWRILAPEKDALSFPAYRTSWVPLAIGFSGIVLCHVLSCEMAVLFTALVCLVCIRRVLRPQSLLAFCKAVGASVLACLWFLVPFLDFFVNDNFSVNSITGVVPFNLTKTAVYFTQIFQMFVNPTGYSDPLSMGMAAEMPLSMGLVPAMAAALLGLCMMEPALRTRREYRLGMFCLGLGGLAAWLTTDLFPWYALADHIPLVLTLLTALQYLWRFLAVATLLLIFAGCAGLSLLDDCGGKKRVLALTGAGAMLAVTLVSAFWLFYQVLDVAAPTRYYDLQDLDTATSQVGSGEYLPAESWESMVWGVHESTAGEGVTLERALRTAKELSVTCTAPEGGWVDTQLLHYRYYTALDEASGTVLETSTSETGFLRVSLPEGYAGTFAVRWQEPLLWRLSEAVSLLGVLSMGAAALWRQKRHLAR